MPKKTILFLTAVALFAFFILFSYLVAKEKFVKTDFDTTVKFQDRIPHFFDSIFSFHQGARTEKLRDKAENVIVDTGFSAFSDFGKFELMFGALVLIIILIRKWFWGIGVIGLFGLFHIIEIYGKWFVEHAPPPQFMLRTKHLFELPAFHVRAENSYPSGHAGRSAFVSAFLLVLVLNSKKLNRFHKFIIIALLIIYDLGMYISRIYLAEHWVSDVIGGALLGTSFGILAGLLVSLKAHPQITS